MDMLEAFVALIPKADGAVEAQNQRPITLVPMLIRVWSSIRARCFLKQLAKLIPQGIRGGVPGGEAGDIFLKISAMIEAAWATNHPVAGFVCDITKCFNALPRGPVQAARLRLGMAPGVVRFGTRTWDR